MPSQQPAGILCQWSGWSQCSDYCGGPDTRIRTCDCRTAVAVASSTRDPASNCSADGASQSVGCPNSGGGIGGACFYTAPAFIVTMFGLLVLLSGGVAMLCWRRCRVARRLARATDEAAAVAAGGVSLPAPHPLSGQCNPAYQYSPPAYRECVLPRSASSSAVVISPTTTSCDPPPAPPTYDLAVAQMKRQTGSSEVESPINAIGNCAC